MRHPFRLLVVLMTALCSMPTLAQTTGSSEVSVDGAPHSSAAWRLAHTPMRGRIGAMIGDQAGGPIRYNTRFPELKSDPHPSSYYHAPAFAGLEGEFALRTGALLVGTLVRRDPWHKSMASRSVVHSGESWVVESFDFHGESLAIGWVFGERYREAPWTADCALVYDQGEVKTSLSRSSDPKASEAKIQIKSASLRSRLHMGTVNSGALQVSVGPEIHLPLWSQVSENADAPIRDWVLENVQLKNSAAIGFGFTSSLRF
jgi:hypothetical protein